MKTHQLYDGKMLFLVANVKKFHCLECEWYCGYAENGRRLNCNRRLKRVLNPFWKLDVDNQLYCVLHALLRIAGCYISALLRIAERYHVEKEILKKIEAKNIFVRKRNGRWVASFLSFSKASWVLSHAYELGEPIRRFNKDCDYGRYTSLLYKIIYTINEKKEWTNECKEALEEMKELELSNAWIHEQGSWYCHIFTAHGEEIAARLKALGLSLIDVSMTGTEQFHRERNELKTNGGARPHQPGEGHATKAQLQGIVKNMKRRLLEAVAAHRKRLKSKKKRPHAMQVPEVLPKRKSSETAQQEEEQEEQEEQVENLRGLQPISELDLEVAERESEEMSDEEMEMGDYNENRPATQDEELDTQIDPATPSQRESQSRSAFSSQDSATATQEPVRMQKGKRRSKEGQPQPKRRGDNARTCFTICYNAKMLSSKEKT